MHEHELSNALAFAFVIETKLPVNKSVNSIKDFFKTFLIKIN